MKSIHEIASPKEIGIIKGHYGVSEADLNRPHLRVTEGDRETEIILASGTKVTLYDAVEPLVETAETFHALPCDCDLIERGKQDPAPMGNNGPSLPSGWGDLYNRDGYRRGRVHVSHVPETLRYPHVVIVGANDYPLRELVFGETDVLGDRHATVSNGVWTVIMDAVIAA